MKFIYTFLVLLTIGLVQGQGTSAPSTSAGPTGPVGPRGPTGPAGPRRTTKKPLPVTPNLASCAAIRDLYDESGNYLKSACLLTRALPFANTSESCAREGMKLFEISSQSVDTAIKQFAAIQYPGEFANLWVNLTLFQNECTVLTKVPIGFIGRTGPCLSTFYSFCEYNNVAIPGPPAITQSCASKFYMFSATGIYLKGACYLETEFTKLEAVNRCKSYNMVLINAIDNVEKTALFDYSSAKFPRGTTIWVTGSNTDPCTVMQNFNGPFAISSFNCVSKLPAYCQY